MSDFDARERINLKHYSHHASGSLVSYTVGFLLSVGLTAGAFLLVVDRPLAANTTMWLIAGLAVAQFLVQLFFFLHLGREGRPRWNVVTFLFALMVIIIVVFGSLWIMQNLNYHDHNPDGGEAGQYLIEDEGFDTKEQTETSGDSPPEQTEQSEQEGEHSHAH